MGMTQLDLSGRRVLLVEDDFFIVDEMVRSFEAAGAEIVGPAPTVRRALDLIAGEASLDGAVLDINLRGEQVYPVADALAARGVPFLFTTGYDQRVVPARYGHIRRCEKPINPMKVAEALFA